MGWHIYWSNAIKKSFWNSFHLNACFPFMPLKCLLQNCAWPLKSLSAKQWVTQVLRFPMSSTTTLLRMPWVTLTASRGKAALLAPCTSCATSYFPSVIQLLDVWLMHVRIIAMVGTIYHFFRDAKWTNFCNLCYWSTFLAIWSIRKCLFVHVDLLSTHKIHIWCEDSKVLQGVVF